MAKATEHPSVLFGTAGRAFHNLEVEGVNTRRFLKLIVDQPDFRRLIVDAYKEATGRPEDPIIDLPTDKIPEGAAGSLAVRLFGSGYNNELYDKYVYLGGIMRLLDALEERERGIIILRFGLTDNQPKTRTFIGQLFCVSAGRIGQLENRALHKMRMAAYRDEWSEPRSILSLDLSDYTRTRLLKGGIKTIDQLREKTENNLRSMTYFNQKEINEVKAKLDERGLSLRNG